MRIFLFCTFLEALWVGLFLNISLNELSIPFKCYSFHVAFCVFYSFRVFRVFILNITEDIFVLLYVNFVAIANSL